MKIRQGFVSNSSSSSFICDVCGTIESGMDCWLDDLEMSECVNAHVFCNDHLANEYTDSGEYSSTDEVPEKDCPVCQGKVHRESDIIKYLQINGLIDIKKVQDEINGQYKNYREFEKEICER